MLCRQETNESASKRVSRACRVNHLLKRVSRGKKHIVALKHEGPVLALFDDDGFGSHVVNGARSSRQEMLPCQLPCFLVIHCQHIHSPNDLFQIVQSHVHPKIHGVQHDKLRCVDLIQHRQLHRWIQVAEHDKIRSAA